MTLYLTLAGISDTDRLGGLLSRLFQAGLVFGLSGPLGVGKSELARAMLRASCSDVGDMPSPTFTLVQTYETDTGLPVWHMDLYRVKTVADVLALGVEDAFFEAVCLIEWPELLADIIGDNMVHIEMAFVTQSGVDKSDARTAAITAPDALLTKLQRLDNAGLFKSAP